MRYLLIILLGLIGISGYSETSYHLRIRDQYEKILKNTTITINTVNYTSNDSGYINLIVNKEDSLVVTAVGYKERHLTLKKVIAHKAIVIDKVFDWKDLLNPQFYIKNGGLWVILFIVFAETGLFFGFFFPGDALLFVTGIYSRDIVSTALFPTHLAVFDLMILWVLISTAGIAGNFVGYWFGDKSGHFLYHKKDTWFFKKRYLLQAHDFYEKNGGKAIIIARFLPIVRTFAPIVAGVVEMNKKKFIYYNIIGCFLWVGSMLLGGKFLQSWILRNFDFNLKDHLEVIVIGIVAVTTLPVIWKLFLSKKKEKKPA